MQNYRNNMMPYNNYRQQQQSRSAKQTFCETEALAMAYVPWQKWQNIYDAEKGLACGTIFQDLYLPFRGIGGCQK